jgi:DNA modification methylase
MYVSHLVEIFREVRRVLRKDGTFWLNLGDSYWTAKGTPGGEHKWREGLNGDDKSPARRFGKRPQDGPAPEGSGLKPKDLIGIPWMVAFALRTDGWWLRQDIVWQKKNPMPESVTDRCTKAHEYVFLMSKSARYYYDAKAIAEPVLPASTARVAAGFVTSERDAATAAVSIGANKRTRFGLREGFTMGTTRNKRDVWTISTRPHKGAHFAVFPPALVEPCILAGTSEKGCCPKCGSPWERVIETSGGRDWHNDEMIPKGIPGELAGEEGYKRGQSTSPLNDTKTKKTVGWEPTCDCNEYDMHLPPDDPAYVPLTPVPCTVLDPFGGSGTTGEVAERLGRNSILIELNPSYVELAKKRTIKRVPVLPGDSWNEPVTRV